MARSRSRSGNVLAVGRFTQTGTIRWLTLGFVVVVLVAAFYRRVARQLIAPRRPYRLARKADEPDGSITLELEAVGHSGAAFRPGASRASCSRSSSRPTAAAGPTSSAARPA